MKSEDRLGHSMTSMGFKVSVFLIALGRKTCPQPIFSVLANGRRHFSKTDGTLKGDENRVELSRRQMLLPSHKVSSQWSWSLIYPSAPECNVGKTRPMLAMCPERTERIARINGRNYIYLFDRLYPIDTQSTQDHQKDAC